MNGPGYQAPLSGTYASFPKSWGPGDMLAVGGSPVTGFIGTAPDRIVAWLMDAAGSEYVGNALVVPTGVTSLAVDIWWTNTASTSGDVVWRCSSADLADGDTASSGSETVNQPNVTVASPTTTGVVKKTTLATNITVTPGALMRLHVERVGANAADTLANDAGLLAVVIRQGN